MKGIYQTPRSTFNGKIVNIFSVRLEKANTVFPFLLNILLKILARAKGKEKKKKHYNNWNGKKRLLFTHDMIAYVENPRESINNHYQ